MIKLRHQLSALQKLRSTSRHYPFFRLGTTTTTNSAPIHNLSSLAFEAPTATSSRFFSHQPSSSYNNVQPTPSPSSSSLPLSPLPIAYNNTNNNTYSLSSVFHWGDQYLSQHFPNNHQHHHQQTEQQQQNKLFTPDNDQISDFHDETLQLLAHVLHMDYKDCKRALYSSNFHHHHHTNNHNINNHNINTSSSPLQHMMTHQQYVQFCDLIKQRAHTHQPLQYLTGETYFYGRCFHVNSHVLIPRMDSEVLVDSTLHHIRNHMSDSIVRVLDVGTGSGCLIISLLCELMRDTDHRMGTSGVALDISHDALQVARHNANRLLFSLSNHKNFDDSFYGKYSEEYEYDDEYDDEEYDGEKRKGNKVELQFVQQDLFRIGEQQLEELGSFNVIVSNPPYIASSVIPQLSREVREHEPVGALDGGHDGLDFYRKLVQLCDETALLDDGGLLALEIGYDQSHDVRQLILESQKLRLLSVDKDLAGIERVIIAMKREESQQQE